MDNVLQAVPAVIETTPAFWLALAKSLPPELFSRPPAKGEWSAIECLGHLVDAEKVLHFRYKAFMAGRDFPGFNPDTESSPVGEASPLALAQEYASLRAASLEMIRALSAADLNRTARHAELGMVTLGQMVYEWAAHDLNHTIQAERALIQPFIQGCGPWQKFFISQVIEERA
jgi:hypothetical protein